MTGVGRAVMGDQGGVAALLTAVRELGAAGLTGCCCWLGVITLRGCVALSLIGFVFWMRWVGFRKGRFSETQRASCID